MSHTSALFEDSQSKLSALLEDSQSKRDIDGDVEMSTSRRSEISTQSALAGDVHKRTAQLRSVLMMTALTCVFVMVSGSSIVWRKAFGTVFFAMALYLAIALLTTIIGPTFFEDHLKPLSEKYLGADTSSRLSHHVVLATNAIFGAYCVALSFNIAPEDFYSGNPEKYWADPTISVFCAATPLLELILGVFFVTNNIDSVSKILVRSVPVQAILILAQVYWMAQNFDEQHGVVLTAGLMATQQLCFYLGVYLGWQLLDGHKTYYDEVAQLKVKFLEQRVEKLSEEKERLDFDRRMVLKQSRKQQERLARLEEERETSEEASTTRVQEETSMRSCEPPPSDCVQQEQQLEEEEQGEKDIPATLLEVTDLEALEQRPILVEDVPPTLSDFGKAQSSAGWSTISALINKERAMMREMADEEATVRAPATHVIQTASELTIEASATPVKDCSTFSLEVPATTLNPNAKPFSTLNVAAKPWPAVEAASAQPLMSAASLTLSESTGQTTDVQYLAKQRNRRLLQLEREIDEARKERTLMGLSSLAEEPAAICECCGGEHNLKLLLTRHPGKVRIKVVHSSGNAEEDTCEANQTQFCKGAPRVKGRKACAHA